MNATKQINVLAAGILLAGLVITALSWRYTLRVVEEARKQDFELRVVQAEEALSRRIGVLTEVLQGVQSAFSLQPGLSRDEFRRIVYRNGFLDRYPGVQVIGYIREVDVGEKAAYEARVRSDRSVDPSGYRHFTVHPAGERPEYHVITYVEPMAGNEKAFGFDIGSEPVRRLAMEMARDSGLPAATGGITLVQETGTQTGLLLMVPLYAEGKPLQTVEQRRQAFRGLVYLGLRVGETVKKAFSGRFLDRMGLQIFGIPLSAGDAGKLLLFDSRDGEAARHNAGLSRDSLLDVGGRKWRLVFSDQEPVSGAGRALPLLVLLSGLAISLLLFWLVRTLANSNRRAVALADQMTRQLRDSELRSRTVLDNVLDGIITINEQGGVESFNRAAEQIFGYLSAEVVGRNVKMLMPEPYHSQHDTFLVNYISSGVPKIIGAGREVTGLRKDGSTFPMDLAVTEIWLEGHHIFTGIVRDISQRKRAEEIIARTGRLNQVILDSADYSMISTNQDGIIVTFNRAAEKMLGYRAEELVGKFTPELIHDEREVRQRATELAAAGIAVEPGFRVFGAQARRGQADTHEWTYIRKDGSRFPVLLTVTALHDEFGAITGYLGMARDISEQRAAEQALRESSDSLMRAQQIAHIGNWDWNIETGDLRWSDEIYRIFGLQPQQFGASYEAFLQTVHPDDRLLVEQAVGATLSERSPYSIDHRIVLPDGRERVVHEQGEVMFDESGKPVRMLGTVQDITERKRNENELRKLSRAVEQSPVSVLITDAKANIEYVNTKFSEVTGYTLAEVIGKNPRILQSGLTRVETYQSMWQSLNEGKEWRGKLLNRKKSGELFWEEVYISAIRNSSGRVTHYIGVKEDVTERMRIEEELARANRQTELILEAVEEGIFGLDLTGNITFVNPSAARMLGYRGGELIGRNAHSVLHHSRSDGTTNPLEECAIYRTLIEGTVHHVVSEVFWREDGRSIPVDYVTAPMREGEKTVGAVVAFRDITESLKIERMKSEFISTVSHELRTPLTSIRGAIGLIAGGVAGELPAQARALLEIANKNSERLILLVNDILDMEKIEAGKMELQIQPAELMPLLHQAIEGNRSYAEQLGVRIELESALPGVKLNIDANRFLQVLANLLSNAAKFSPQGDSVLVAAIRTDHGIRVTVKDHGPGIQEEFRGRIFQKFAQADSSDTRSKGGSGLGLSITKALVEKMGGRIGFDSMPMVCTTFFVDFPEWTQVAGQAPASGNKGPAGRVLVCEDDHDVAELLRLMLEQEGIGADIAHNAAQAKQMLAQRDYAAMTLDLSLPDQDGVALIRELRAAEATANLPIVVVSARAVEGREELDGSAFSVIDWIGKPINQSRLVMAIKQVAGQTSDGQARILHVEDDPDVFQVVDKIVGDLAELDHAASLCEARQYLGQRGYDLVILDLNLPDGSGMELIPVLNNAVPPIPVMVFSAHDMEENEAQNVAAVLVKSRTSNELFLEKVRQMLEGAKCRSC